MREHPILMSGVNVRNLLDGLKTHTRRTVKGQALEWLVQGFTPEYVASPENSPLCRYGYPGDLLWVRETFAPINLLGDPDPASGGYLYRADMKCSDGDDWSHMENQPTWKPSIHMPRRASRITLKVVSLKVEHLQDISHADIIKEGWRPKLEIDPDPNAEVHLDAARDWYMDLWEDINGVGSWALNPLVWVVETEVVT